jgi:hypothetical protein
MTAIAPAGTGITPTSREQLATRINGRAIPVNPTTLGPTIERDEAYRRADQVIADGWALLNAPVTDPDLRAQIAAIVSGAKSPSERAYKKADEILALLGGRA